MILINNLIWTVAMLSRALQTERIGLTAIVDAAPITLDNVTLPVANWVLELMDVKDEIEESTNIEKTSLPSKNKWLNPSSQC